MGPEALAQVLRPLTKYSLPNLLIGLQTGDDAAVYRLSPDQAIVQTVDFFPPVVDDPYTYGAIAAANSMSDVYAMGGEVLLALNVAAFPDNLPVEVIQAILQGGADKMAEGGGVIAGGHTVTDREPKYGLSVTGLVHPQRMLTKGNARPGDTLVLTKPLGTGVITTALKAGKVEQEHIQAATDSMLKLNRRAAHLLVQSGVRSCTDITGFSLLGHAWEMASASSVGMSINLKEVPLLPGATRYAIEGFWPGGMWRNRYYLIPEETMPGVEPKVLLQASLPEDTVNLLFDPETSGGLLAAVPPTRLQMAQQLFTEAGEDLWIIGEVVEGSQISLIRS